ncbi:hypothetical protein LV75_001757 [Actinokineospora diospyrosa]|uniref:Uncharacterized protein n=1 Tax=Actinokineospora diospyrosa TaxID=103728 RepID=A0ABT1I9K6_9PSEU|nr:hypothetical protein [Actinokineospora diospyrosa]
MPNATAVVMVDCTHLPPRPTVAAEPAALIRRTEAVVKVLRGDEQAEVGPA